MTIIKRLYNEFAKGLSDEYYVELACKDVMIIPLLIDIMMNDSFRHACRAQNIITKISNEYPDKLLPFFSYIINNLENSNAFIARNTWRIIINIIRPNDVENWICVCEKFYSALYSSQIAEFSVACDCVARVVHCMPFEKEKIILVLNNIDEREFKIGNNVSVESLNVAKEKASELLDILY